MMAIEVFRQAAQAIGPGSELRDRLRHGARAAWQAIERASGLDAVGPLMQLSVRRERTDPALAEQLRLAAAELAAGVHRPGAQELR